jgi:hypothetical protein
MNMLKQSAANAQQYLKNLAALQQAGKYNPDYEDFILGGNTLDRYDTLASNAIWNRVSPDPISSLTDEAEHLVNKRTARELTKEDIGDSYDPMKKYKGWLYSDLLNTVGEGLPGFLGT